MTIGKEYIVYRDISTEMTVKFSFKTTEAKKEVAHFSKNINWFSKIILKERLAINYTSYKNKY